jgi:YD repeat-containing protein
MTATNTGEGNWVYTYDRAGRLATSKQGAAATITFGYDAAGNRTSANGQTYTYDQRNRLLTGAGTTYTWTPRGTLATAVTGGATTTVTFDALDG